MFNALFRRAAATTLMAAVIAGSNILSFDSNQAANAAIPNSAASSKSSSIKGSGSGSLNVFNQQGKALGICPLKHTAYTASVSGYVSRVTVRQSFVNPYKDKIEAIYTFPLSDSAAVDDMVMKVGKRTIHGTIKRREEAKSIYEAAKARGNIASLLDQERENIFTQSVANIMPGEQIDVTLTYVDLLPYESGKFTLTVPTVVGPRFIPGNPTGMSGAGRIPDTDQVPDASRITPPIAAKDQRAGHDISIDVDIDAGVPIKAISSKMHQVNISSVNDHESRVSLKDEQTIPNRDFVLNWQVSSDMLSSGYLTHKNGKDGFFTLMILPPKRVMPEQAAPKEMIFIVDCSGSQSGLPLQKAKETLNYIVDHMNSNDTFQIISFNNKVTQFADKPQQVSAQMIASAKKYISGLQADGGTIMLPAVEKACSIPSDDHRLRIVTMMTDGYIGNDYEIVGMVKKLRGNSRWFPFGTGCGVNRLLIDNMAKEGGGEPDYVLLNSSANEVGKKFYDRIASPVLTDIKLDFHGLPVKEVFPHEVSDVWAERPLYIKGRYTNAAEGTVTISGFAGGKPYKKDLHVILPDHQNANQVVGSIWARSKVDRLMSEDYQGAQSGNINTELKEEIVNVALAHHIMTNYTSFVAVEDTTVTEGGKPRTVAVPVELPVGVRRQQVLQEAAQKVSMTNMASSFSALPAPPPYPLPTGGGVTRGTSSASFSAMPAVSVMLGIPRSSRHAGLSRVPEMEQSKSEDRIEVDKFKVSTGAIARKRLEDEDLSIEASKKSTDKLEPALRTIVESKADSPVMVEIWLKATKSANLAKLKKLGIKIRQVRKHSVVAELSSKQLIGLTQLDEVIKVKICSSNQR